MAVPGSGNPFGGWRLSVDHMLQGFTELTGSQAVHPDRIQAHEHLLPWVIAIG